MSAGNLESELLRRAVGGDRASLAELLLLHYDGLQRHVGRRIRAADGAPARTERLLSADDVLHQTLVRAAQRISTFRPRQEGTFRAWLFTIADNLIKDAEKRRRRERRAGVEGGPGRPPGQSGSWAALVERIAGDGTTASAKTQRRENARRLQAALAALPDDYRNVIERYYLGHQSLDEIAQATGATKGSVRAMCYRGRKRLRELMGRSSLYFSG